MLKRRLLTIAEAAAYLGLTVGSLYQRVHKKTVPYVKLGKSLRFDLEKLDELIEKCSVDLDRTR